MAAHFFFSALFLLFSAKWSEAVDFACPTDPVYRQSGTFPKDVPTLTTFPQNYNCDINFLIEDGYVYKLTLVANVTKGSGDSLIVTNALGKQMTYTEGVTLYFAPAKSATVSIKSTSGTSQFWFRYEMTDVKNVQQLKIPTGSHLNLFNSPLQAFTFISPYNDKVVLNTGMVDNINQVDVGLKMFYVYDGLDLSAPYVGSLYDYVTSPKLSISNGNATTITNFYGTSTTSYVLANDYKPITLYDTYNFIVYSKTVTIPEDFQDGISNAYTFYCTESDTVYLTDLNIGTNGMKVDFRTLTPSDEPKFLLEYLATGPYRRSLPQMIPGRKFTMVTIGPEMTFTLSTTANNWLTPYNGRRGTVFSASLWNPGATSGYNYTFESTELMSFTFNFHSIIVHQAGEQAQVKVGRPGVTPISVTFSKSVADQVRVANGTYLTTSYNGDSPSSSSIITFEMFNADGSQPTTTTSVPTTSHVETTTKVGFKNNYGIIGFFVVLVIKFLL